MTNDADARQETPTSSEPTWPGEYETGLAYQDAGEMEAAARCFASAVELAGEEAVPELLHDAGAAHLALNHEEEADKLLLRAVDGYAKAMDTEEDMPHLLYGQARSFALLDQRQAMLDALTLVIDMEDRYAHEALTDPDFSAYAAEPEFKTLLEPVAAAVTKRLFRGAPLLRCSATPAQVALVDAFVKAAARAGWLPESAVAAAFDDSDGEGVSPQARWRSPRGNGVLAGGLDLHADTGLLMLALIDPHDEHYAQQLRLYLQEGAGQEQVTAVVEAVAASLAAVTHRDAWTDVVAEAFPYCGHVELEVPGGDRLAVTLDVER